MSEDFISEQLESVPLHSTKDWWSPVSIDSKFGKIQFTIRLYDQGNFIIGCFKADDPNNCPRQIFSDNEPEGWGKRKKLNYSQKIEIFKCLSEKEANLEKVPMMHFDPKRTSKILPVKIKKIIHEKAKYKYNILTHNYVGQYVAYDEDNLRLCFDIRPRFGEQLLAYMLTRIWRSVDSKKILQAVTEDATGSLIFLALVWMGTFSEAFKSGLPRLYVPKKGDIPALKGRLDINRMIKNRMTGRNLHLIPCRYRELSYDNIINRVIRRCYRIVRTVLHGYLPDSVSGELGRVEKTLASYGVPFDRKIAANDLDHIHYTSMAEAYEPLMKISKALIRSTPENLGGVLRQGQSFLFDITELWEFYFMAVLKEKLGGQYIVKTTNLDKKHIDYGVSSHLLTPKENADSIFALNPDILIYERGNKNSKPLAILDGKFKRVHNEIIYHGKQADYYGVKESDIRQLIAYCAGYGCKKGALIYPWDLPLAFVSLKDGESKWHDTHQWKPSQKTWQTFSNEWTIRLHSFVLPILFDELRNEVLDKDLLYPFYKIQVEKGKVVASLYWLRDNTDAYRIQSSIYNFPVNKETEIWSSLSYIAKYKILMEKEDKRLNKFGLNKKMVESKLEELILTSDGKTSREKSPLPKEFEHLEEYDPDLIRSLERVEVKSLLGRPPDFRTAIRKAEETFANNIKEFLMKDCK